MSLTKKEQFTTLWNIILGNKQHVCKDTVLTDTCSERLKQALEESEESGKCLAIEKKLK